MVWREGIGKWSGGWSRGVGDGGEMEGGYMMGDGGNDDDDEMEIVKDLERNPVCKERESRDSNIVGNSLRELNEWKFIVHAWFG